MIAWNGDIAHPRRRLAPLFVVLLATRPVLADTVLLATYDLHLIPGQAPLNDPRVQFGLQLTEGWGMHSGPMLADSHLWSDGESGSIDFLPQNAPNFDDFAALATNGVANWHYDWAWWAEPGGGGSGSSEIHVFHQYAGTPPNPPDLAGNTLEMVRLIVDSVQFRPFTAPMGEAGFMLDAHLIYEFYGSPLPEPGSFAAWLVLGFVFTRRHRKRAPDRPDSRLS